MPPNDDESPVEDILLVMFDMGWIESHTSPVYYRTSIVSARARTKRPARPWC